jgi:hypothetical protein
MENIAIDTVYYIITKFGLYETTHLEYLKNVNTADIVIFMASDYIYGFIEDTPFFPKTEAFKDNKGLNCDLNKYLGIMALSSAINLLSGGRDRILDNAISIGASGAISTIIDQIRAESRCTENTENYPTY